VASARTGTGLTVSGTLPDTLIDLTRTYYISDSVPVMVTLGLFGLVFGLSIGSTDPWRFVSKTIQVMATLILIRAITALCTVYPVPSTVLTTPDCYDSPYIEGRFKFGTWEAFQCNHSMFSIYAASTTMCIWILVLYIRYGPLKKNKWIPYSVLILINLSLMVLPVLSRVNYAVEAFIGACVASILVLSQSPAYKLLFRFEQSVRYSHGDDGSGMPSTNELLNDRIVPGLEESVKQVEVYLQTAKATLGLKIDSTELATISHLYTCVGDAIKAGKVAVPLAPMSAAGPVIPQEIRVSNRQETPATSPPPEPGESANNANDIVGMIYEAQTSQSNSKDKDSTLK
jgi:hypothetical protein